MRLSYNNEGLYRRPAEQGRAGFTAGGVKMNVARDVLFMLALILAGGWAAGRLSQWIRFPKVLGMMFFGVLLSQILGGTVPRLGETGLNLLEHLDQAAPFLKSLSLIIILLRAGLGIRWNALKKVGAAALRMAAFPALLEACGLILLMRFAAGFSWPVSVLAGIMLSAVSPAMVVPAMLDLKEQGKGTEKEIPTLMLVGAGLDNVLVITLFSLVLGLFSGEQVSALQASLLLPKGLVFGIVPGIAAGFLMLWLLRKFGKNLRGVEKLLILLVLSVVLMKLGQLIGGAWVLGLMALGIVLATRERELSAELSGMLGKLWVFGEIILFVLIGLSVQLEEMASAGFPALLIISGGLITRSLGVLLATAGSRLLWKERLFAMLAYLPKATVQAVLGTMPLREGIAGGETILAFAVMSIVFTAPLGMLGINWGADHLLQPDREQDE